MNRWEAIQREAYRRAILRQIIREELERREERKSIFSLEPFDPIPYYRSSYKTEYQPPENEETIRKKNIDAEIIRQVNKDPGPFKTIYLRKKKKSIKRKLKRKSCSCKKN